MANENKLALEWRRGYYCACANIMGSHGDPVITEDVLRACGRVNFEGIDAFDIERLKPVADEIARKNTPTPARSGERK